MVIDGVRYVIGCSSFVPIEETEMQYINFVSSRSFVGCSSFVPIEETEMRCFIIYFLSFGWLQFVRSDRGN